jgi:hypothetical protein
MTTSPVQSVTEEMLAELQAKMETSDEGFSADEVEPLIATIRQQRADDASTSGNKYRAELYDEVWEQARSMGYGNVTNALVELERLRAAPEGITMERIERHAQPAGECPSSAKVVLLSSIKRLLAAPAAPAPAAPQSRVIRAAYEVLLGCVSSPQIAALIDVPTVERVAKQLNDLLPGHDTPEPAAQEPSWGYARTIGNLVAQLGTLDPEMPIYAPLRLDDGRVSLKGLTLSKEWKTGRFIQPGEDAERVAVLWTQPQTPAAQKPVAVEVVAVTRDSDDGLYLDWAVEGGIDALEQPGVVLLVAHSTITDERGRGEVYNAPPAAEQPDTVPVPRELARALLDEGKRADTWAAQDKLRALLGKDGEE